MQRAIAMLLVLAAMGFGTASAMVFGVGPMLGEPMGLTAQVFPGVGIALVAGVGYSWWQDTSTQLQGDLIFTGHNLTSNRQAEGAMAAYMGLGAQARFSGGPNNPTVRSGLRMPMGIIYMFPGNPALGLYVEADPRFNLGTDQYFSCDAVCGLRIYWGRVGG